ncbi:hypothetical protein EON81_14080 [bacterium]|nr:MAG: hypothetical protein EON81_14080 [bacterium]
MLAAMLLLAQTPALTFSPQSDVWVYPHASDPSKDAYLRVWGTQGEAVAPDPAAASDYSYSYLRFDLPAPAEGRKLSEARLEVTQVEKPSFSLELAKSSPLQARPLLGEFDEKTWTYGDSLKIFPGKEIFGEAAPEAIDPEKPTPIVIDLMKGKGDFRAVAEKGGWVNIALTSTMDVASGERTVYRLYSKDTEKEAVRPKLVLKYE